jgi:hypothetical protein
LCAQWKAADATTDSAWWTAVGTWVSGVSGLLVIAALYLAFQSNRIARDTAKRQLRAYLHVTDCDQTDVGVGQSTVANITVTNGGQTPAHDVTIEVVLGRRTLPLAANAFDLGEDEDPPSKLVIGPGKPAYSRTAMPAMTQAEHTAFQSGQSAYFTYGRIIYRDVFNERHQSLFRMKLEKTGEWQLCAEGNEAD